MLPAPQMATIGAMNNNVLIAIFMRTSFQFANAKTMQIYLVVIYYA